MRRLSVVIAALVALVVGGLILTRVRGGDSSTQSRARADAASIDTSDDATEPPLIPGPERAAVAAVALTDDVARAGFISRRDLIKSFTTPAFGAELADETSEQLTELLVEFSGRTVDVADLQLTEQPLRVRTSEATSSMAQVDVWSVLVVAIPGASTARVMWRTVKLDLLLVEGQWLVDGWESVAGPTPMVGGESPISSAGEVAEVLAWTPIEAEVR